MKSVGGQYATAELRQPDNEMEAGGIGTLLKKAEKGEREREGSLSPRHAQSISNTTSAHPPLPLTPTRREASYLRECGYMREEECPKDHSVLTLSTPASHPLSCFALIDSS